jgi:hypothetical protein
MATQTKPEPGTAVATQGASAVAKRVDSRVAELRERNALVTAIRGTQWGKDVNDVAARAIAHYCNSNGLDPVRHVELLGGKIYLTASFYEERGAPFLQSGKIRKDTPDFIQADERLDKLAADGDEWAIAESTRRIRLRITHGVPESAKAACIQRLHIQGGGAIVGVNWCGGVKPKTQYGKDADPIGEAEPTKTAETRAARRAWKQLAEVIPGYGAAVKPIEASARIASDEIPVEVVEAPRGPKALAAAPADDPYGEEPRARVPVAPDSVDDHADADRGEWTTDDDEAADLDLGPTRTAPTPRRTDALREG